MKILHIVSLITPTGTYGGPVRVAVQQVKALSDLGHEVTLAAGTSGFGRIVPEMYDGVPVKLFKTMTVIPKTGFAGITSLGLLKWIFKEAKNYDIIHIHLARDFLTLAVAHIIKTKKIPYVLQTHGMIDPSKKLLAKPLDLILTKPVLRNASRVFYLNKRERNFVTEVAGSPLEFEELRNGVESKVLPAREIPKEKPIEVLFLSRLDPQKRAGAFVEMAVILHVEFPNVQFRLVGPDEGDAAEVMKKVAIHRAESYIAWEGPLPPTETENRMNEADIFVLPSYRDTFPMSVLEAMSLGIPVVVTISCGLSSDIEISGAGLVVNDDSPNELAIAVSKLLSSESRYNEVSKKALQSIKSDFSSQAMAASLNRTYSSISDSR